MSNDMVGYETVKPVSSGSNKKTPIVKITTAVGTYLKGILLSKKSYDTGEKNDKGEKVVKLIATFKLIETNAVMIAKGAQGYAPVEKVAAGSEVTIFGAPARLERALMAIEEGGKYEVYIVYKGKVSETVNGRKVKPHTFEVGKKAAVVVEAPSEEIPD